MKLRIFSVFVFFIVFVKASVSLGSEPIFDLLPAIEGCNVEQSNLQEYSFIPDTVYVKANVRTANEPIEDSVPDWIQYVALLALALYELIIHVVPTSVNYSLIRFIGWFLAQLSNWLNRKKIKHPKKFTQNFN